MTLDLLQILPIVASAIIAGVGWLARSYLEAQRQAIIDLKADINKAEGKSDAILHEIRENTVEIIKIRGELSAIWRFIDSEPKRASDRGR